MKFKQYSINNEFDSSKLKQIRIHNFKKLRSKYSNLKELADDLVEDGIRLVEINSIIAPFGNITSLSGLQRFTNVNSIDLRGNKIQKISNKDVEIINRLWFESNTTHIHDQEILSSRSIRELVSEYGVNYFILLLSGNPIEDGILKKIQLNSIPIEYSQNQNNRIVNSMSLLIDEAIERYNFSGESKNLQEKYNSLNAYLIAVVEQKEKSPLRYSRRDVLEDIIGLSTTRVNGRSVFITDLNPYKENVDVDFDETYAYLETEEGNRSEYRMYHKYVSHINPIYNIASLEKKYKLDLSYFKRKCGTNEQPSMETIENKELVKKYKENSRLVGVSVFLIVVIVFLLSGDAWWNNLLGFIFIQIGSILGALRIFDQIQTHPAVKKEIGKGR